VYAVRSSADKARAVGLSLWARQNRPLPYLLLLTLEPSAAAAAAASWGICTLCASLRCKRPDCCVQQQRARAVGQVDLFIILQDGSMMSLQAAGKLVGMSSA
jgi:hypothetical protein